MPLHPGVKHQYICFQKILQLVYMKEDDLKAVTKEDQEKKDQVANDKTISGHTDVKNAHASGLGSMGRNDEEEEGIGRTEKD